MWYAHAQVYPNMRAAFVDIFRTRGIRGLYSGLTPTLVEIIPYAGLQFGTYDTFKRWLMVNLLPSSKKIHGVSHLPYLILFTIAWAIQD